MILSIKKRTKKAFSLIELVVVIVVLGILTAIVLPNIATFKEEAKETAIVSDVRNIQTAVDLFMLEQYNVTPTKIEPTFGHPQTIELYSMKPNYIRDTPQSLKEGMKFWLDENHTVWASTVDAPSNVKYNGDKTKLIWDKVDGAASYKVYTSEDATISAVNKAKRLVLFDTLSATSSENQDKEVSPLSKGTYLVTAIDQFGFESPPTRVDSPYTAYSEPDQYVSIELLLQQKSVTLDSIPKEPQPIKTDVPVGWIGIYSIEDLAKISKEPSHPLNANYILMNNLDFSQSIYKDGLGWEPIGLNGTTEDAQRFIGDFDGNGLTISNLYINRDKDYVGIFSRLYGKAYNLTLKNANVKGTNMVGTLAGFSYNNTNHVTVVNSKVTGVSKIGGLFGTTFEGDLSYIVIENIELNGISELGGIAGENKANIEKSSSTGIINGTHRLGGIVGSGLYDFIIKETHSSVTINGNYNIGGIVGLIKPLTYHPAVENSYFDGHLKGKDRTGGIVGQIETSWEYGASIRHSYMAGTIENTATYATGSILGTATGYDTTKYKWWVYLRGNRWDTNLTTYQANGVGYYISNQLSRGIPTEEFANIKNFSIPLNYAWDFNNIWYMDEQKKRPILKWEQ